MRRLKVVGLLAVGLLALAGVAQASGVLEPEHKDPSYDVVEERAEQIERALVRQKATGNEASASAVRKRGPRGPRGKRGPRGAKGAPGGPGAKGTFGSVVSVASGPVFLCSFFSGACAVGSAQAVCPPGTIVTGGGYTGAGIVTTVTWSAPVGNAWAIIAVNLDEVPVPGLKAIAECATV